MSKAFPSLWITFEASHGQASPTTRRIVRRNPPCPLEHEVPLVCPSVKTQYLASLIASHEEAPQVSRDESELQDFLDFQIDPRGGIEDVLEQSGLASWSEEEISAMLSKSFRRS